MCLWRCARAAGDTREGLTAAACAGILLFKYGSILTASCDSVSIASIIILVGALFSSMQWTDLARGKKDDLPTEDYVPSPGGADALHAVCVQHTPVEQAPPVPEAPPAKIVPVVQASSKLFSGNAVMQGFAPPGAKPVPQVAQPKQLSPEILAAMKATSDTVNTINGQPGGWMP